MSEGRVIRFELTTITPRLNQLLRKHHRVRARDREATAWAIRVAAQGQIPPKPFIQARVRIERHSVGVPDHDGLVGGVKDLVDCLIDPHPVITNGVPKCRHPCGLGFVLDDSPAHMTLEVVPVRVGKRALQKTVVEIHEIT